MMPPTEFDLQPTLRGELLELRPLTRDDFDALFVAASDPLIWEQHPESERYEREVFQRYFDSAIESGGAFAIIERSSDRIIGSSRYCNLNMREREIEVGWTFLERKFWGGRYNCELKALMLSHAFRFVDRVLFVVGEANIRSQKALEKIGARLAKKMRVPAREGGPGMKFVFAIRRDEFVKSALRNPEPTGLEPATSAVTGRRSSQLS
jgi:RimJ/RimL family protein N-acetyltransferase